MIWTAMARGHWLKYGWAILLLLPATFARAGSLEVKTGIGFDYFSQSFQIDSLTVDTLEATINLGSTYIDNLRAYIGLVHAPMNDRSMLLKSRYEQSVKETRLGLAMELNLGPGSWRLYSQQELNRRASLEDSLVAGQSYWHFQSRNRLRIDLGWKSELRTVFNAEIIKFDSVGSYNQDFNRIGGEVGISRALGDLSLSSLSIDLFVVSRQVPDSTAWNYLNTGAQARLSWLHEYGEFDLSLRGEHKDYDQPDKSDDFSRYEAQLNSRLTKGNWLSFKQVADFEAVLFGAYDDFNYDYTKLRLGLFAGYESLYTSLYLGPTIEWLTDQGGDSSSYLIGSQRYTEIGLMLQADYMRIGRGFISLESEFGRRDLNGELPYETDFYYERLGFLLEAKMIGRLRITSLLSFEWEFHENKSEDNHTVLVSSGLSFSF